MKRTYDAVSDSTPASTSSPAVSSVASAPATASNAITSTAVSFRQQAIREGKYMGVKTNI